MNFMESSNGDDTVFYEELTRQILMIMDDDNETDARNLKVGSKVRRSVAYSGSGGGLVALGDYFSWSESVGRFEVPTWMERLWGGNVAGTGVFMPRVEAAAGKSRRRRRNKPRKNNVIDGGRMHSSAGHMIHG
ncbi:hypothetical protein L1987_38848 [Smallanthus sonchifolius]|uniref:Uncharacterized protein n=1 Tax=Smallanthus sonchifolius TaxID=185202 RepID=A0ACB9HL92_9ASTR|nr:hypothetical protein L1987_38848 [Smallanthus sonchifolius]